jgi:nucleotide-binding universal stress UspA family protein
LTTQPPPAGRRESPSTASVFARIVVGVDGTEAGFEACRQTARLAEPDAAVEAVAVVHVGPAVAAALDAAHVIDVLKRQADEALERAIEILGRRARRRYVDGFVSQALLDELDDFEATLVALGTHGHRRASEILLGGVAGEILHRAPCSVLLARPCPAGSFPRTIVVGHDGSAHADAAVRVAGQLATRRGSTLRVVTALRGKRADLERVRLRAPSAEELDAHPVAGLVSAAADVDLLVVGSRGLHGIRALGSVSERVAHQAGCSVLVVRDGRAGEREDEPC